MDRNAKLILLAIGLVLVILLGYSLISSSSAGEITFSEFLDKIFAANDISVVMDVRGSIPEQKLAIMQCATDLSGSGVFVGKNLLLYGYDDSGCVLLAGGNLSESMSIEKCDALRSGSLSIIVKNAPDTKIYSDRMVIGVTKPTVCKLELGKKNES